MPQARTRVLSAAELRPFESGPHTSRRYETHCIAPHASSWSLDQLRSPTFRRCLGERLAMLGIRRAFIPRIPSRGASGVILEPKRFTDRIELPYAVELMQSPDPTEGTVLEPNDSIVMAAGGCALLCVTGPNFASFAHASRDALLDRQLIDHGTLSRADFSVIDSIARTARERGIDLADLTLRWFYELSPLEFPHWFDHPVHGQRNRTLDAYLEHRYGVGIMPGIGVCRYLDLGALIAYQARAARFGKVISGWRTLPVRGPYAYTTHPDPILRKSRNLIVAWLH